MQELLSPCRLCSYMTGIRSKFFLHPLMSQATPQQKRAMQAAAGEVKAAMAKQMQATMVAKQAERKKQMKAEMAAKQAEMEKQAGAAAGVSMVPTGYPTTPPPPVRGSGK